jgi:hypothetical protein
MEFAPSQKLSTEVFRSDLQECPIPVTKFAALWSLFGIRQDHREGSMVGSRLLSSSTPAEKMERIGCVLPKNRTRPQVVAAALTAKQPTRINDDASLPCSGARGNIETALE